MISGGSRTDQIHWIKDIEIAEDGTVTFIYCDDTVEVPHRRDSLYKIKYIKDVYIDSSTAGGEIEGSQKLNFVVSTYYKGTGIEKVLQSLETYIDSASHNFSEINNI